MPQIPLECVERCLFLFVLTDLEHARALRGIARFTGKHQFGSTEPPHAPDPPKWAERCFFLFVLDDLSIQKIIDHYAFIN